MTALSPNKKVKPKKCKAPSCGKSFIPRNTLQQVCFNILCAKEYSRVVIKKRFDRENHKEKLAYRAKDLRHQRALTQKIVNQLCNLLDSGLPCISCSRPDGGGRKRNASHFKSVGSNSNLRFNLLNIHSSCVVCNQHQSGNIEGYRKGLAARYGEWIVNYLDNAERVKAWTADELRESRKSCSAEIRVITKTGKPSKDWRRHERY